MIQHKAVTDYFYGVIDKTNILDCSSFGLTSTIATDLGNTVIYTSLLIGGSLYVFSNDESTNPKKLSQVSIDCFKMVPSHWKVLQQKETLFVPNKCLILGGEQFTQDIKKLIVSNKVDCQVYNHYGPTETTIGKLIKKISFKEYSQRPIPLGVPFGNTKIFILDSRKNVCPIGVSGELCIGGAGLARGYLNRPDLTSEKFIKNPFSNQKEARLYRTGDLARWLPDGNIEYLGRIDDQVKIRGYRIELGEIEHVLQENPLVKQAVVIASADTNGSDRLVAYIVAVDDFDKDSIRLFLKDRLPDYMVPQIYVKLDAIPLTNNGKIDKKSLPVANVREGLDKEYVAPKSDIEKQLCQIWKDLLGLERVGIHDNFFELGG
ncbi:MAG: amino acid adenylation domain-containing protein, partial [Cyanobacteria bacterium P01_A01_bin.84]